MLSVATDMIAIRQEHKDEAAECLRKLVDAIARDDFSAEFLALLELKSLARCIANKTIANHDLENSVCPEGYFKRELHAAAASNPKASPT